MPFDSLVNFLERVQVSRGSSQGVTCPICKRESFSDGSRFVDHLIKVHQFSSPKLFSSSSESACNRLPQVGDKILAMWSQSMWQYFPATIVSFDVDSLQYTIDWDDGDTTGRVVDYFNIALDRIPYSNEIGIGTVVLFPQGQYNAGATQVTGGDRWHQGKITSIFTDGAGVKRYSGCHSKGEEDGKFTTYKDYNFEFTAYHLRDLRVAPNVFDILAAPEGNNVVTNDNEDIDIFFSFTNDDSPYAMSCGHIPSMPTKVNEKIDVCDPVDLAEFLRSKGFKVFSHDGSTDLNMKTIAQKIKKAKVFVGCISDCFVENNSCRMEFQYAKTTLQKPVVPLIVGYGSFDWTSSVIGLLIAGELYIHFKDRSVMEAKQEELLKSLANHLSDSTGASNTSLGDTSPPDVFISYCWTNSYLAQEASQIKQVSGSKYADPRLLKAYLEAQGLTCWLDIEKLQAAQANSGLFDQLTSGIKSAKVVVPCISDEYAKSQNCRMEYQFALKSLAKPVVPVVVGQGEAWKQTVVGALISTHDKEPIDLRAVESDNEFDNKLQDIMSLIWLSLDDQNRANNSLPVKSKCRAPQVGDHVVCHHFNWSYYMATVVDYDAEHMEYTVDWDDGDPTGRVQPYNQVAVDRTPDADDIGVDSIIFFPQGVYVGTEGNNTGGMRYHEGVVTKVGRSLNGEVLVSGHHTKTEADGKHITSAYVYEFYDLPLSSVRIAPTALDAAMRS